jgi:hypothetical protein
MSTNCSLCEGDGWICDGYEDYHACSERERLRFAQRMDYGRRIACPRCQPDWQPPLRPPIVLNHQRRKGVIKVRPWILCFIVWAMLLFLLVVAQAAMAHGHGKRTEPVYCVTKQRYERVITECSYPDGRVEICVTQARYGRLVTHCETGTGI